ncbi:hypothetical protein ACFUNF_12955 [Streptomyces sp. NPDC057291]|uniref:hypothetical protein n=1 Tax=Streptomyces sp. NPDC057291 TaxID=3346087 RepID=UPI0036351456
MPQSTASAAIVSGSGSPHSRQYRRPTQMRSHDREAVHKVCAEDWCDQKPNSNRVHN